MTELYINWYECGKTCLPELDYPDHIHLQICEEGETVYEFYIDNVSYDDATFLYENLKTDYDVFFDTV